MNVLVVYASRYGSTQEITESIAGNLREQGLQAEAKTVDARPDPGPYDAVVIGSAVYMGHWMKEAGDYVRRYRSALADRPVWLFSSGPLKREDRSATSGAELEPAEIAEFREAIHPRDHRVFSGALRPDRLGLSHRVMRKLPAGLEVLPEGDFRDWQAIDAWAGSIPPALTPPEP